MATTGTLQKLPAGKQSAAAEREIIATVARTTGHAPSEQGVELSLEQARALGEL